MGNGKPNASQQAWQRQTQYRTPTQQVAAARPTHVQRKPVDPAVNAASFWNSYQPAGLDPLLTLEMKDALVWNQTNFVLEAVELRTVQNRQTWVCKLDIGGEKYGAMFTDNAVRSDLYTNLQRAVAANGPMLVGMMTFDGNPQPGFDLCAPYTVDADMLPDDVPQDGAPFDQVAPF